MKSASFTASIGSSVTRTVPPLTRQFSCAQSSHCLGAWYFTGAACVKCIPSRVQISINELNTLVASPMKVTLKSSSFFPGWACSIMVNTSHTTWVGWL